MVDLFQSRNSRYPTRRSDPHIFFRQVKILGIRIIDSGLIVWLHCQPLKKCLNQKFKPKHLVAGNLERLILLALEKKWSYREFFTTTEIAHLINEFQLEKPKHKDNISRYFNQRYFPYYEIKLIDGKRKNRLSNTGYGKALLLKNNLN